MVSAHPCTACFQTPGLPAAGPAARGAGGLAEEAKLLDRMAAAVAHTLDSLMAGKHWHG